MHIKQFCTQGKNSGLNYTMDDSGQRKHRLMNNIYNKRVKTVREKSIKRVATVGKLENIMGYPSFGPDLVYFTHVS